MIGSRIAVGVIGIANVANNLATSQTTATKGVCVLRGMSHHTLISAPLTRSPFALYELLV